MAVLKLLFFAMLLWAVAMAVNTARLRQRYRKNLQQKLDDEYKNGL